MTPPILTRLTLLPRDDARPATMWWLDAAGTIVADGAAPPRATPAAARVREIVAVPGEAVRLLSLEIPTRIPAQAVEDWAAARKLPAGTVALAIYGVERGFTGPAEALASGGFAAMEARIAKPGAAG